MNSIKSKKILSIMLFALAALSLIFAIVCFGSDTGYWVSSKSYGGDAYTGIQNAAAQTANNINYLRENINTFAGLFFVIVALTFAAFGVYNFIVSTEKNQLYYMQETLYLVKKDLATQNETLVIIKDTIKKDEVVVEAEATTTANAPANAE